MARTDFKWTTHADAARDEALFWQRATVAQRVAAVEAIRRATLGIYGDAPVRLERVHTLVVRETSSIPRRRRARARGQR